MKKVIALGGSNSKNSINKALRNARGGWSKLRAMMNLTLR
jgi:hypothetical protein